MQFTPEKKKEIEKQIVDTSITALEQGAIEEEELGKIAAFVLDNIDNINNQEDFLKFLRELSSKWYFFSDMLVIESGEIELATEKRSINKIEELSKNGNIDEAIKLAKQALEAQQT